MTISTDFTIRDYRPGDETQIVSLMQEVFGKRKSGSDPLTHWRWEFLSNPIQRPMIKLAWSRDRLVGQYAVNPVRFRIAGNDYTAAISLDTMTAEAFRKKGVFFRLADQLYQTIAREGVVMVFGFPNHLSMPGFVNRLGWNRIMDPSVLVRPINGGWLFPTPGGWSGLRRVVSSISRMADLVERKVRGKNDAILLRQEKEFGAWADELWIRCRDQHALWTVRDRRYLTWRYSLRPGTHYSLLSAWDGTTIVGMIITREKTIRGAPVCLVMECMADTTVPGVTERMLDAVIRSAYRNGLLAVSALVAPGSSTRKAFLNSWFLPLPVWLFPSRLYFGARVLNDGLSRDHVLDPSHWYLSWGDDDFV